VEELEARTLPSVYSPAQIVAAYGTNLISFNGVKGTGAGQTIAIVDAYYDAGITNDLKTFNTHFGLPQLDGIGGDGKFTVLDLSNKTPSPAGDDWTLETSLDVEWAHAVAPKANIVLVEAASDNSDATGKPADLLTAVQKAASYSGVTAVSMSWGINEVPGETGWDSVFNVPGVTFFAASGDSGAGTIWPAVSPYVVSVGGTTLKLTSSNTISSESGWGNGGWSFYFGGSGGGFSQYEPLPSYQKGITTSTNGFVYTSFGARLNPDVSYDADPNTGYNVYDTVDKGWNQVGGTSAGAPQWAALMAITEQGRLANGLAPLSSSQTLAALYSHTGDFHDIKGGNTGTYDVTNNVGNVIGQIPVSAVTGYDLVTGIGTPIANLLVPALAGVTPSASTLVRHTASHTGGTSGGSSSSKTPLTGPGDQSLTAFASVTTGPSQLLLNTASTTGVPAVPPPVLQVTTLPPTLLAAPHVPFYVCPLDTSSTENSSSDGDATPASTPATPENQTPTPMPQTPAPQQVPGTPPDTSLLPGAIDNVFRQDENDEMAPQAYWGSPPVGTASLAGVSAAVLGVAFHQASVPSARPVARRRRFAQDPSE
jgi:subtilase family serine protease